MPSHDELVAMLADGYRDVPGEEFEEVFNSISPDQVKYIGDGEYEWVEEEESAPTPLPTEPFPTAGRIDTRTRPIEIGIVWEGASWSTETIQIPLNTPESRLRETCEQVFCDAMKLFNRSHEYEADKMFVVHVWVYNSLDDEIPEETS